jgi:hypothetical protein
MLTVAEYSLEEDIINTLPRLKFQYGNVIFCNSLEVKDDELTIGLEISPLIIAV